MASNCFTFKIDQVIRFGRFNLESAGDHFSIEFLKTREELTDDGIIIPAEITNVLEYDVVSCAKELFLDVLAVRTLKTKVSEIRPIYVVHERWMKFREGHNNTTFNPFLSVMEGMEEVFRITRKVSSLTTIEELGVNEFMMRSFNPDDDNVDVGLRKNRLTSGDCVDTLHSLLCFRNHLGALIESTLREAVNRTNFTSINLFALPSHVKKLLEWPGIVNNGCLSYMAGSKFDKKRLQGLMPTQVWY